MSSPSDDDADSELSKYAPKGYREQPATPDAERQRSLGPSPSIARWSTENHQNRQITPLSQRPVPEPPARGEDGLVADRPDGASGGCGGCRRIGCCLWKIPIRRGKPLQFGFAD